MAHLSTTGRDVATLAVVHPRQHLTPQLRRLARCQGGVVSRRQLLQSGLSRRAVDRMLADWTPLARGIYLLADDLTDPPWTTRVWAGVLLGGPQARVAGLAAAALQGLAAPADLDTVDILVPHSRTVVAREGFRFLRERCGVRLPSPAGEPPRTRVEDTTLDLCSCGAVGEVVTWLTRACQRRLTTADRLRERVIGRPRMRHRATVLQVLDDVAHGATSVLEHRALVEVLRPHGLPTHGFQHRTGAGRVADLAFPEFLLLIEFDGRIGHVEEGAFRDRRRDNSHALIGWTTLRFGWSDVVGDPCGVAAQIAAALIERGWPGPLDRCPRCPR